MIISDDGKFMATFDNKNSVCLFKYSNQYHKEDTSEEWWFVGKHRTHQRGITSICFGQSYNDKDPPQLYYRLFSIGNDRLVFEYDTTWDPESYSILKVIKTFPIELESRPTACIWYPQLDLKEELLLTCNEDYKMKLWNPTTENSRRTCLGPTYGGAINKLKLLSWMGGEKYLLYSTEKKVIGLIKLPLDGNPNKTMGLIAHPEDLTDIACSPSGQFVFTCGGSDLSVNMWQVDVAPIEQKIAAGFGVQLGQSLADEHLIQPFINLIEGGQDGQTFQDMNDFFYYSMIRSKKENTTKTRKLDGKVPVDEINNLMKAMGYYPTKLEEKNMYDEVRNQCLASDGTPTTHIGLNEFIKLFVNHRPVYGIGQ